MAITKLSSGPYTIHTLNASDPITLDAGSVYINGNLTVTGTTSTIETTNTTVYDNIISLNGGITGTPFAGNTGIEVNRGGGAYANTAIVWDEVQNAWTVRVGDGSWKYLLQSTSPGSGLTAVVEDPTPALGGNLNLNSKTLYSNVGNMNFIGNLQLDNTGTIPSTAVSNATVLYATNPGAGQTGLYVLNGVSTNEELVTKRRALGFSLLF